MFYNHMVVNLERKIEPTLLISTKLPIKNKKRTYNQETTTNSPVDLLDIKFGNKLYLNQYAPNTCRSASN